MRLRRAAWNAVLLTWASTLVCAQELTAPREARDRGDVQALERFIQEARARAGQQHDFESYLRLALLNDWMCEAATDYGNNALLKKAAGEGLAASEKAIALNPRSADAHWLAGDLLGQMIPHVFAGGMRFGHRATNELEAALAIDPNHAGAMVSRAAAYFFTPAAFGGDHAKAIKLLENVLALNPSENMVCSARLWLARIFLADGKREKAKAEAEIAERLNPGRLAVQHLTKQLNAAAPPR